jgi:serine/threonine protein kinase
LALTTLFLPKFVEEIDGLVFDRSGIEHMALDEQNQFLARAEGFLLNTSRTLLIRFVGDEGRIAIPASVEVIGDHCFSSCDWISEVYFVERSQPRRIEKSAFLECSSLARITIPASVEEIGELCFSGCSSLSVIVFDGASCLKEIHARAFQSCCALTSLFIPKTVEVIAPSAFEKSGVESIIIDEANACFFFDQGLLLNHLGTHLIQIVSSRECVSIPETVMTISESCFSSHELLSTIEIPKRIEIIPTLCFFHCSKLCNLSVESGSLLRRIENSAFFGCSSLKDFTVPSSVEFLGPLCFSDCQSLAVVTFQPDSHLKQIGMCAFWNCPSLRQFDLPKFVEVLGYQAFADCISLSEFCVPADSRLERIESECFCDCPELTHFALPASIRFIGPRAFPWSCAFDVQPGTHENTVREWCVRFLLNRQSIFRLTSRSDSDEQQSSVFQFDHFQKVSLIGEGCQGEVHLYHHNDSIDRIAVKSVSLQRYAHIDATVKEKVLREVKSLVKFRHPSIVPLLGYDLQIDSKLLRIAMPYIGSYSLESVLKSPQNHPWLTLTAKTIIIVGIVIGMYFVHCGGIIHRDLKPANVLLDPITHYPKIADFGLSREGDADVARAGGEDPRLWMTSDVGLTITATGCVGSPLYRAPEIISSDHYSNKVDVFSFGVLLYEIVTGKQPIQGVEDNTDVVFQLFAKVRAGDREPIPETVEPFTASLISCCWDGDPHNRPTFQDIFDDLRYNSFKIFSTVDPEAVVQYLQSLP